MIVIAQHASNAELAGFRWPELAAVACMHGVKLSQAPQSDVPEVARSGPVDPLHKSSEYFSICRAHLTNASETDPPITSVADRLELQRRLKRISGRSVLLEEIFEPIVIAGSLDEAVEAFGRLPPFEPRRFHAAEDSLDTADLLSVRSSSSSSELTFSVRVESYEHKYSPAEKLATLKRFPFDQFHPAGKVQLQKARDRFVIFLEHERLETPAGAVPGPSGGSLQRVLICHAISGLSARKELLEQYSLKQRPYIGTTSMPPELTFLMCNLACVRGSDLVMDPFCGTGSTLVTAGHWGAMTIGTDMDGRVMRSGTAKVLSMQQQQQVDLVMSRYVATQSLGAEGDRSACSVGGLDLSADEIRRPSLDTNFKVYRTKLPGDPLRLNFSNWSRAWRPCVAARSERERVAKDAGPHSCDARHYPFPGWLDAIVTDPPYGIREQKLKVSSNSTGHPGNGSMNRISASSSAENYDISVMIADLFLFAAESLVLGGRLCFWLPTSTASYSTDEIPSHPLLVLRLNEAQNVSLKISRRLVVMEKVRDWLTSAELQALENHRCMPAKSTDEVRKLMDITEVPDNADYQHYRAKLETKREASRRFREAQLLERPPTGDEKKMGEKEEDVEEGSPVGHPEGSDSAHLSKRRQRKLQQQVAVRNRALRMDERAERHAQSIDQQRRQAAAAKSREPTGGGVQ
jgi:tRNA (guanine10-N2)-methyltransferase